MDPAFRGYGAARSSSDAAFEPNLEAEVATAVGEHTVSVFMDMFKCCDYILVSVLLVEARALQYPLCMMWMLLCLYRCPRVV